MLVGRDAELLELHDAALRAAADRRGWVGLTGGVILGTYRDTELSASALIADIGPDGPPSSWTSWGEASIPSDAKYAHYP